MKLEFQAFQAQDMAAFWALHNSFQPGHDPEETWLERAAMPAHPLSLARTAWLEGTPVGFWRISAPRASDGARALRLAVRPEFRCQGVGGALWRNFEPCLDSIEASLQVTLQDPDEAAHRFLERRGFSVTERSLRSVRRLGDPPDLSLVRRLETQGYRFFRLSDTPRTPENRLRLYELVRQVAEDDPGFSGKFASFEDFEQGHSYWDIAHTVFVAAQRAQWVGVAGFRPEMARAGGVPVTTTGVARAHRGRGLAQAVKLLAIKEATTHGYLELRAANDSRNATMLAINLKLGFVPSGEFVHFERTA